MNNSLFLTVLRRVVPAIILVFLVSAAFSQSAITLNVDASDAAKNRVHVFEKIPVRPGKFRFLYPKWIQGEHRPSGPLNNMMNLQVSAGGKAIAWSRDNVEMFAFSCDVPKGVTSIDVSFDDLADWNTTSTANLARIKWNRLFVAPRGVPQDRVTIKASLKMPAGWQYATALPVETQEGGGVVNFKAVDAERLVDSPAIIGLYFRKIPLSDSGDLHEMDIAADSAEALEPKPETIAAWRNLVQQGNKLFGAHHYRSYRFLLTLSNWGGNEGLEHHESSEDGLGLKTLSDPEILVDLGELLGHEYAHSWNGKYRRPLGLSTPDFEKPMDAELLWVYEGLTQYLGYMLAVRSGMWTPETFREVVADTASFMGNQGGRSWRPLADTAKAVHYTRGSPAAWGSSRRNTDYYWEGMLIWLEADTIIRQKSGGKKSLDDFLQAFYGQGTSTGPMVRPYTLPEVNAALNRVTPYDWATFFRKRVYDVDPAVPLGGINSSGWRLEYSAEPNTFTATAEKRGGNRSLKSGIGFTIDSNAVLVDVKPGTPADRAGLVPNMMLVDKDGKPLALDVLVAAITAASGGTTPIPLIADLAGVKMNFNVDYHGGIRYAHLVRDGSVPDMLSDIAKPK